MVTSMLMTRSTLFLLLGAAVFLRADTSKIIGDWDSVSMAPVKTSIYVGSVKLTTSEFRRAGDKFTATYEAKVWPWFFWSESGKIAISLPLAELEKLARGERVEFSGEAFNHKYKPRHVTGRAERTDPASGTIKVRIRVDDTELIFNTTYRFNNVVK
jgi:hypothetical protein